MKFINKIDLASFLLFFLIIRILIFSATIGDSIAIIGLSALIGYQKMLSNKEDDWKTTVQEELNDVKNQLVSLRMNTHMVRKNNEQKIQSDAGKRYF